MKKISQGKVPSNFNYSIPDPLPPSTASILIVLGATNQDIRMKYRQELLEERGKTACPLIDDTTIGSSSCDIYYLFVIGGNPNGTTEKIDDSEQLVLSESPKEEPDLLILNVR